MITIYYTCLGIGVIYSIISVILGSILDDVDIDIGLHTMSAFPLKPITVIAFITTFGGSGITLGLNGYSTTITLIASILLGYTVSIAMYKFIVQPLNKMQNTGSITKQEIIGLQATVNSAIQENGYGQIAYHTKGSAFTSPAKSITGKRIEAGELVKISTVIENIYYVEKL